jgi:hypothetical protein
VTNVLLVRFLPFTSFGGLLLRPFPAASAARVRSLVQSRVRLWFSADGEDGSSGVDTLMRDIEASGEVRQACHNPPYYVAPLVEVVAAELPGAGETVTTSGSDAKRLTFPCRLYRCHALYSIIPLPEMVYS